MVILFDIGKSKMRLAQYTGGGSFDDPMVVDTPDGFEEMIQKFGDTAREVAGGKMPERAVGGVGAPLDKEKQKTVGTKWVGEPLKQKLEESIGAPVHLENDAMMGALGEAVYGAGKGSEIVAYLTVSTGVGGGRVVGGEIDEASVGFEPGHQIIDADKTLCPDCEGSTLEEYVSGTAVEKRFGEKPYDVKDPRLWEEELPQYLAYGIVNTINYWSPDVIVLGGSMITGNPAISVSATRRFTRELAHTSTLPEIKKADLGDGSGLYGAMVLAHT